MQYKTVAGPVGLTISGKEDYSVAVKQYAAIIDKEAVGGWKFELIKKVPVTKETGCLAILLGQKSTTVYINMLVFSRDDAETTSTEEECTDGVNSTALLPAEESLADTGDAKLPSEIEAVSGEKEIERIQSTAREMLATVTKRVDKKKMAIIAAAAVLLLVLIICVAGGNRDADDGYYGPEYIDAETKEFCDNMEGVWVIPDSIYFFEDYEPSVCFDYLEFRDGHLYFATYVGECYSNKQIISASMNTEAIYDITLYEPAIPEDHLNGPREESWLYCTIYTLYDYLEIYSEDSLSTIEAFCMGQDLSEAIETAEDYYAYYSNDY